MHTGNKFPFQCDQNSNFDFFFSSSPQYCPRSKTSIFSSFSIHSHFEIPSMIFFITFHSSSLFHSCFRSTLKFCVIVFIFFPFHIYIWLATFTATQGSNIGPTIEHVACLMGGEEEGWKYSDTILKSEEAEKRIFERIASRPKKVRENSSETYKLELIINVSSMNFSLAFLVRNIFH